MDRYRDFAALELDDSDPGILRIVLDNPGKLNSLTVQRHADLAHIWPVIDRDPDVRVVLVHGAGGAFSAGGDMEMLDRIRADAPYRAAHFAEARALVYNIVNCSKPIVSAVQRVAVGGGLATALLADISVVGRNAKIIDGHVKLGVPAGDHSAMIWPLLCGVAKAKYYLMTGQTLLGEEAERIGMFSVCVDDDDVISRAEEIAHVLNDSSPDALSWTKLSINNWLRSAGPAFDASLALELLSFTGVDVAEGIAAIREKRPPSFR